MADRVIRFSYGMPVTGREMGTMELFMNSMTYWEGLKAEGQIADVVAYGNLSGDLRHESGMMLVSGSAEQISALKEREDYRELIARCANYLERFDIAELETGDAIMTRMQRWATTLEDFH